MGDYILYIAFKYKNSNFLSADHDLRKHEDITNITLSTSILLQMDKINGFYFFMYVSGQYPSFSCNFIGSRSVSGLFFPISDHT